MDECHRGSARDDSSWRAILNHFEPAFQLGMTATPLPDDNRDTYLCAASPPMKPKSAAARVRDDDGTLWFNLIDDTGSATRLFADPAFDGDPVQLTEEELEAGSRPRILHEDSPEYEPHEDDLTGGDIIEPGADERRKYYFDEGQVEIAAHLVYDLDPDGKQLRVVRYTDYAAENVRTISPTRHDSTIDVL